MKKILFILFLILSVQSIGQEIVPAVTANNKGVAVQLYFQQMFNEGDFNFGPRFGGTYHPLNPYWSHFYFQQIIEYKGFFISPFWLRSYNKSIGYQVPTSLGYMGKTSIADIEVWGNYVYHARSFDLHIVISPKKRIKLDFSNITNQSQNLMTSH